MTIYWLNFYLVIGCIAYLSIGTFLLGIIIGFNSEEYRGNNHPKPQIALTLIFWPLVLIFSLGCFLGDKIKNFRL